MASESGGDGGGGGSKRGDGGGGGDFDDGWAVFGYLGKAAAASSSSAHSSSPSPSFVVVGSGGRHDQLQNSGWARTSKVDDQKEVDVLSRAMANDREVLRRFCDKYVCAECA